MTETSKPFTYGSLFSGIGGLDLGFDRSGLSCAYQIESDEYANRVLAKHWPDVVRFRDVRDVGAHNLPYADVIAGGFPCTDISYAGKGAGLDGEHSGLWYEFARIVGEMGPRIVVVENVAALLTRGIDAVLGTLASLGFDAQWHCIPAAAVGAPHQRDRVFIVAHSQEIGQARGWGDGPYEEILEPAGCRAQYGRHWSAQPRPVGVAYGISNRLDRLGSLGNAVVPQVAQFVAEQFVLPRLREGGIK